MTHMTDAEILEAMDLEPAPPEKRAKAPPRDTNRDRLVRRFEEIMSFVETRGRLPREEVDDLDESSLGSAFLAICDDPDAISQLKGLDRKGILPEKGADMDATNLTDADILDALGLEPKPGGVSELKFVRPAWLRKISEEIANREVCKDFATFKPLFDRALDDLDNGLRKTLPHAKIEAKRSNIDMGKFFIVGGQTAYIADMDKPSKKQGREDGRRVRVIFNNGTQCDLLIDSFLKALWRDKSSRIITDPDKPLFETTMDADDRVDGTIYVLRTLSDDPVVTEFGENLHKIGVTSGDVGRRIANAANDPTYLFAGVEVVAEYQVANTGAMAVSKMESLLHDVFASARANFTIRDRFDRPVKPREWFLVPLPAVQEAVKRIGEGTLGEYVYNSDKASLDKRIS